MFKRISPDGKTLTDRSLLPEWIQWLKVAAAEDPDPAVRAQMAQTVTSLETAK